MQRLFTMALLALVLVAVPMSAQIQNPFDEPFNYALGQLTAVNAGANVSGGRWANHSGSGNPIQVISTNLTYPNFGLSGLGKGVQLANPTSSGEDANIAFDSVSTDEIIAVFLLQIDNSTGLAANTGSGDYFAALSPYGAVSNYTTRLAIRLTADNTGFQLGIRGSSSSTAVFDTTKRDFATTYLVGMSYRFEATAVDTAYLFVNPTLMRNMDRPTPVAVSAVAAGQDAPNIARFSLRQGTNTPNAKIAGLRIDTRGRFGPTGKVKFTLNTATVPDTLKSTSTVQVRGSKYPLTWGGDSPKMTNAGGDYWNITHTFQVGDTVYYKYFVEWGGEGWEGGSDKQLAVTGDTTLALAFFNRTGPPYTPTDTLDVWFRVNMRAREDFIPGTDQVQVRGSFNGWSASTPLAREGSTHFYSGWAKTAKTAGPDTIYYKFTFTKGVDVTWESISDRMQVINNDTTLYWAWFNNSPFVPLPNTDTMIVTFRTNLSQAISQRGFTADDTLIVETGYSSTAKEVRRKMLTRQGLTFVWQGTDTLVSLYNRPVQYKYYRVKPGKPDQEDLFYDFAWTGDPGDAAAQKRKFTTAVKTVQVDDIATGVLDPRRVPFFPNKTVITRDSVEVTYTVDLRPAIYKLKAGGKLIATNISAHVMSNPDSVLIWGVWMNGPAVGGWDVRGAWGAARRGDSLSKMYDNGTHGDAVAGDSIFSLKWMYRKSENATVGQEFKFGVGAFDNEAGFGNNHYENIDDSQTKDTIASQLGSINPTLYPQWDFDLQRPKTSTSVEGEEVPMSYELRQNYPNPFNPATTIQFDLPVQSDVTLKVFNALGQEVATVVTGVQSAGTHRVTFDASNLATGIYFYQIKAGEFTSLKKMVLIK